MKNIITLCLFCFTIIASNAQSPKIDKITGIEILKLLPTTMQGQNYNTTEDRVVGESDIVGVSVHRSYGAAQKKITLEVINYSPSVGNVNADLNKTNPGKKTKTKVNGYKAIVQPFNGEAIKTGYELFIPLDNTTLIMLKVFDYTINELISMAQGIPVSQIEGKVN
jgi:hypothetical protein